MMYTHIIWDFNGTLIDDVEIGIKTVNTLLKRRGLKTLDSKEDYHKVFGFPIIEYYKKIGFDFDKESFNDIAVEWVDEYLSNSKSAGVYEGVVDVLTELKGNGIKQIILSATEREMLLLQVRQLRIEKYFFDILGLDNIHAHSKVDIAVEWIKKEKPVKALLIGDTTHDFEVSKAINTDCILISNGHQSKSILKKCGVQVIDNVKQIIPLLLNKKS